MDFGAERRIWIGTGLLAVALILAFCGVALLALLSRGVGREALPPLAYLTQILQFTLLQGLLSTAFAVIGAVPVALALARRPHFFGRWLVLGLTLLPLGLPVLPAVFGIVEIWGRQGLANDALAAMGFEPFSLYGLPGIVLAHVFFNLPLAARLMLSALASVPDGQWRLAASLDFPRSALFRFVEWPSIARRLPGIAGLIFMLCLTSFTIILTLGGGPSSSTIEVAIYQALKFEFDPPRALVLVLIQMVLTTVVMLALNRLTRTEPDSDQAIGHPFRADRAALAGRIGDGMTLTLFSIFVGAPLVAIIVAGASADLPGLVGEAIFRRALATSLAIAVSTGSLATLLAFLIVRADAALASKPEGGRLNRLFLLPDMMLLVPPLALGSGWFLVLLATDHVQDAAMFIVIVTNLCMALPFSARVLRPAMRDHYLRTARLSASLGLAGLARLRIVDWPILQRPLMTAFSFAAALALGDLGAIALFASDDFVTLPSLLYARLGSYRSTDAAGLALLLSGLCLILMLPALRRDRQSLGDQP